MKIATYNVNGINGRLPVLLRWLDIAQPDIVTLQELKAPQEKFPEDEIKAAGYDAIWHGKSRWNGVAILSRIGEIHETRRGLPGDPDDDQSRYNEAAVGGVLIAGLYLPNGNPRPFWLAGVEPRGRRATVFAHGEPLCEPGCCDAGYWVVGKAGNLNA